MSDTIEGAMAATVFSARVWEIATVTGTGPIALAGTAQPGYVPFFGNIASGCQVSYCAYDQKAQAWETGFGIYTAGNGGAGTLTRSVQQSSTGALINFAGNPCNITIEILPPVQQSAGAASAGMIPALSPDGFLDFSMLYPAKGSSPPSGATVQIPDKCTRYFVRGSSALAELTLILPVSGLLSSADLDIIFQCAVASFTLAAPAGFTINLPISEVAIGAGQRITTTLDGTLWC